jgi:hypothetical protein
MDALVGMQCMEATDALATMHRTKHANNMTSIPYLYSEYDGDRVTSRNRRHDRGATLLLQTVAWFVFNTPSTYEMRNAWTSSNAGSLRATFHIKFT